MYFNFLGVRLCLSRILYLIFFTGALNCILIFWFFGVHVLVSWSKRSDSFILKHKCYFKAWKLSGHQYDNVYDPKSHNYLSINHTRTYHNFICQQEHFISTCYGGKSLCLLLVRLINWVIGRPPPATRNHLWCWSTYIMLTFKQIFLKNKKK